MGLASAGHFGLMAGSGHRLSPWPALEQRSQFLRAQKLTSKVCELASRTSLTPPIPGARRSDGSRPNLQGQLAIGTPCQLRSPKSQRPALVEGKPAAAHPSPRCSSHRSTRRRHGHLSNESARSQPAEWPMRSVNPQGSSPRCWKEECSGFSPSYTSISSPWSQFCSTRLTPVHHAFVQPIEQKTV